MKKITINLDYTDIKEVYTKLPIYFFVGEELIKESVLETEIEDPTDEGKTIPLQGPLIFTTTLEIEENESIILSFDSENLYNARWGVSVFDLFLENILAAILAGYFRIKGHYLSYFLQTCYGFSKRYRLISEGDAVFDLGICAFTKDYPIAGLKYENSETAYIEEFFRPYDIEKEYMMYKKSVIWDVVGVWILILLAIGVGALLGTYHAAGVAVFMLGVSSIVYLIRNSIIAKKQYSKLKENNWNLDNFVNKERKEL